MTVHSPPDTFDLIPNPTDVQRQIVAHARAARLLRRLLKLALAARREREAVELSFTNSNSVPTAGVARG